MAVQQMTQQQEALALANNTRFGHAALKRQLKAREINFAEAIVDERSLRMTIYAVLKAQRGWGESRVGKVLRLTQINPRRRIDHLSHRERRKLLDAVARA